LKSAQSRSKGRNDTGENERISEVGKEDRKLGGKERGNGSKGSRGMRDAASPRRESDREENLGQKLEFLRAWC